MCRMRQQKPKPSKEWRRVRDIEIHAFCQPYVYFEGDPTVHWGFFLIQSFGVFSEVQDTVQNIGNS